VSFLSLLGATATPSPSPLPNPTTGWQTLFLMALGAVVVAGLSILYLIRRFGREVWPERRRDDPSGPPPRG
jgi:hypothetical protein